METIEQVKKIQTEENVTEDQAIKLLNQRTREKSTPYVQAIADGYQDRKKERLK